MLLVETRPTTNTTKTCKAFLGNLGSLTQLEEIWRGGGITLLPSKSLEDFICKFSMGCHS